MSVYLIKDDSPFVDVREGEAVLSYWLSSAGPLPDEFINFMDEFLDESNSDECVLEITTPLSSVVDGLIDSRRYFAHSDKVVFSSDDRNMVSSARDALQQAIAKLDAIQFTDE